MMTFESSTPETCGIVDIDNDGCGDEDIEEKNMHLFRPWYKKFIKHILDATE